MSAVEEKSKSPNWLFLSCISLLLVIAVWVGVRIVLPDSPTIFAGTTPDNLGLTLGKLAPCPNTPNCVSSQRLLRRDPSQDSGSEPALTVGQSQDSAHYIEPLSYQSKATEAMDALQQIVTNQPRTKVIKATDDYLYAQFTSKWMGYVDDVEFSLNEDRGVIDVRSASRLGESDLGVNSQRVEQIRTELAELTAI